VSPDDAKRLVSGPLGQQYGKFPLRFAKVIMFGEPPTRTRPSKVNNATASLLRLRCGPVAITCLHVLDFYRQRLKSGQDCLFQVGGCRLDPLKQIISENDRPDVVVLELTEGQAQKVINDGSPIGDQFYEPPTWPPRPAVEGDDVAFGGLPGRWKEVLDYDSLQFATFSAGHRVTASGHLSFLCEVKPESMVKPFDYKGVADLTEFGGMSGGPVFAVRPLNLEFVGIVREYSSDSSTFYFTHAGIIAENGQLNL
jgi:hypothetical protein